MNQSSLDKILISDLLARGRIGVPAEEREQTQDLLLNIVIYVDLSRCMVSDDVSDSVDYDAMTSQIVRLVEQNQRHTVEALAGDIAAHCLATHGVQGVRVRLAKPNKVRFARAVGIEIERMRED